MLLYGISLWAEQAITLQPLQKYVVKSEKDITTINIIANGNVGVQVLWKREDGLYLYKYIRLNISGDTILEFIPGESEVIYSSNFPYSLTNGEAPKSLVIIQNLGNSPINITKMEVK